MDVMNVVLKHLQALLGLKGLCFTMVEAYR
jgi:hypothetical protein